MRSEIGKIDASHISHMVDGVAEEGRCHDLKTTA